MWSVGNAAVPMRFYHRFFVCNPGEYGGTMRTMGALYALNFARGFTDPVFDFAIDKGLLRALRKPAARPQPSVYSSHTSSSIRA